MIIYIPIKQNSQRVPNKNFREFNGKALWEHTIDKLSNFRVYVDTDSDEIIESCKDKKLITAYKRPEKLRGDTTSVVDLLKNFVETYEIKETICQIHVTSPFLFINHLHRVKHIFETTNHDSVFSADVIQNRFWRKEEYGLSPVNHNPLKLEQTQDLPKYYMENSYLYAFKPEVLEFGNRIGKNPFILEVGYPYNLDIDTEDDWNLVKLLENYE